MDPHVTGCLVGFDTAPALFGPPELHDAPNGVGDMVGHFPIIDYDRDLPGLLPNAGSE
jgi:hypothetical protein